MQDLSADDVTDSDDADYEDIDEIFDNESWDEQAYAHVLEQDKRRTVSVKTAELSHPPPRPPKPESLSPLETVSDDEGESHIDIDKVKHDHATENPVYNHPDTMLNPNSTPQASGTDASQKFADELHSCQVNPSRNNNTVKVPHIRINSQDELDGDQEVNTVQRRKMKALITVKPRNDAMRALSEYYTVPVYPPFFIKPYDADSQSFLYFVFGFSLIICVESASG